MEAVEYVVEKLEYETDLFHANTLRPEYSRASETHIVITQIDCRHDGSPVYQQASPRRCPQTASARGSHSRRGQDMCSRPSSRRYDDIQEYTLSLSLATPSTQKYTHLFALDPLPLLDFPLAPPLDAADFAAAACRVDCDGRLDAAIFS